MLSQFRDLRTMSDLEEKLVVSSSVPEMEGYMPLGYLCFEDVPLVDFIYLVYTRTPGGVTVGDSGLCCCVPCLSSAIISLCLLIHSYFGW